MCVIIFKNSQADASRKREWDERKIMQELVAGERNEEKDASAPIWRKTGGTKLYLRELGIVIQIQPLYILSVSGAAIFRGELSSERIITSGGIFWSTDNPAGDSALFLMRFRL